MNNYKLEIEAIKPVEQSVNHVFAVDVSGFKAEVENSIKIYSNR